MPFNPIPQRSGCERVSGGRSVHGMSAARAAGAGRGRTGLSGNARSRTLDIVEDRVRQVT
jgi:hypothetical protein